MLDSFTPPPGFSLQDRIQKAANQVAQKATDDMVNFDNDIVIAIALIVDDLCRGGLLGRERLIAAFRNIHAQRLLAWTNGYSPLGLLADVLQEAGKQPLPSAERPFPAWLREVINGGLSQNKSPSEPPE